MALRHAIHYLAADLEDVWIPSSSGLVPGVARDGATLVAVVDSGDETYVTASVPRMRGSYAARLLQRRLEREFPEASLRAALTLRQRRGENLTDVVMVAVAADQGIDAHVAELGSHCTLCAVTTPSLLVAAWLKRARLSPKRLLVVLPTPAGLRLVFIEDGQPSLSRLMPPVDVNGGTATEISRTIQYLQNTQRIDHDAAVEIWFWGFEPAQVDACLPRDAPCVLGSAPALPRLPDPARDGLQALFESASAAAPDVQLGADRLRLRWFAHQARVWSRAAAAGFVVAAVALSGGMAWRTYHMQQQTTAVQAENSDIAARHAELEAALASRDLTLEQVRVLPDMERNLLASEVRLDEIAAVIGRAVSSQPGTRLETLGFRSVPTSWSGDALERTCEGETLPAAAFAQVTFGVEEGLDVRARSNALQAVRDGVKSIEPWHATPATAQVGADLALTVGGGLDGPATAATWTLCLTRADAA